MTDDEIQLYIVSVYHGFKSINSEMHKKVNPNKHVRRWALALKSEQVY